jgi:hypothetical protein
LSHHTWLPFPFLLSTLTIYIICHKDFVTISWKCPVHPYFLVFTLENLSLSYTPHSLCKLWCYLSSCNTYGSISVVVVSRPDLVIIIQGRKPCLSSSSHMTAPYAENHVRVLRKTWQKGLVISCSLKVFQKIRNIWCGKGCRNSLCFLVTWFLLFHPRELCFLIQGDFRHSCILSWKLRPSK